MGKLLESLNEYFENTPKEILDKDWKEIEPLNEIGPDVLEYADFVRRFYEVAVTYPNHDENMNMHRFDVSFVKNNDVIDSDSRFMLAA